MSGNDIKGLSPNTSPRLTPPIPWYGGKSIIIKELLQLMPYHEKYIEPFGGAGHMLFAKPPAEVELYNDLHNGVVNFYEVLRDEDMRQELLELLKETPYSREEMHRSQCWDEVDDKVEKARMFYVCATQSFSGIGSQRPAGWSYSINDNMARKWHNKIENDPFNDVGERLEGVQIENRDAVDVIESFDGDEDVFCYADPPYVLESRSKGESVYKFEMTEKEHVKLVHALEDFTGPVILSGYRNDLYKHRLERVNDWQTKNIEVKACGSGYIEGEGYTKKDRTEVLWLNERCLELDKFFDAQQEKLDDFGVLG